MPDAAPRCLYGNVPNTYKIRPTSRIRDVTANDGEDQSMNELPFETWERIFHEPWPGGTSARVVNLLQARQCRDKHRVAGGFDSRTRFTAQELSVNDELSRIESIARVRA
jgi:hypothetical protein